MYICNITIVVANPTPLKKYINVGDNTRLISALFLAILFKTIDLLIETNVVVKRENKGISVIPNISTFNTTIISLFESCPVIIEIIKFSLKNKIIVDKKGGWL